MRKNSVILRLPRQHMPDGFNYPVEFDEFVTQLTDENEIKPWGLTASHEFNVELSEMFQMNLIQFAQAWLEDMVACFLVGSGIDPKVLVVNPWNEINGNAESPEGVILEELPNFSAWLIWVRNSELVQLYAQGDAKN